MEDLSFDVDCGKDHAPTDDVDLLVKDSCKLGEVTRRTTGKTPIVVDAGYKKSKMLPTPLYLFNGPSDSATWGKVHETIDQKLGPGGSLWTPQDYLAQGNKTLFKYDAPGLAAVLTNLSPMISS